MGGQREIAIVGSERPQQELAAGAHHEPCLPSKPTAKQDFLPTADDGAEEQRLTVE